MNYSIQSTQLLVVDDDDMIHEVMDSIGEELGIQVDHAWNGFEGLLKIRNGAYDTVFTDIHMPNVDGIEFLIGIRSLAPDTPVVLLTGDPKSDYIRQALRLSASDFIEKPFNTKQVRDVLVRMLEIGSRRRKVWERIRELPTLKPADAENAIQELEHERRMIALSGLVNFQKSENLDAN